MAQVSLYLTVDSKKAVSGPGNDIGGFTMPALTQGDTTGLSVTLLERESANSNVKVQAALYSIRLGLFLKDGTLLSNIIAAGFTRDDVEQTFTGILPLNTAAITTAMGTGTEISGAVLQVEATEIATGAVTTVYTNKTVTIEKDYLSNALGAVPVGEAAATQAWVSNGFVQQFPTQPSVQFLRSANGSMWRKTISDEGTEQLEPYNP